jgi:hypothetical protein
LQKFLGKMPAGGALLLPEGTWTFYDDLDVPADVWIVGCGWKTILQFKNEKIMRVTGARAHVRHLCIAGDAAGPRTTEGVITVTGAQAALDDLRFSSCYNGVSILTGGLAATIIGCHFTGTASGAKGLFMNETHGFAGWNYFVDDGGGGLELHCPAASCACIGNRMPGGAFIINALSTDVGNYA